MADQLEKIFKEYSLNPKEAAKKSNSWFSKQVSVLGSVNIDPKKLLKERKELEAKSSIKPGSLYIFQYKALHADILPYYDRFPLVIPFRKVPTGFYGLNLHYLPPQLRVVLLGKLMQFANNKNLDETTKLKFTWQIAQAAAANKHISACVKMYLDNQVQSRFMKVNPENWVGALMLPCESFVGSSKKSVWSDSRKM